MLTDIEPCLPPAEQIELDDLALDLASRSVALARQLRPEVQDSVADLVRSMNCYYSNLIEGHNTHPREIENALRERYSADPRKRAHQMEARAHIEVQRLIDQGEAPDEHPCSARYARWVHREFYRRLPEDALWSVSASGVRKEIVPGEFRTQEVSVGYHIPPQHEKISKYMKRFEEAYQEERFSKIKRIAAVGAAHHRFVWIHPFLDGNGRVARLMSHARLRHLGLGGGMWSVARGFARSTTDYKDKLQAADQPRRSDHDGRGARSEKALIDFCKYFLSTGIDQIDFMEKMLQPVDLARRIENYCKDEIAARRLPDRSERLLKEALLSGEFVRGRSVEITGFQERKAREIMSELLSRGLLVSTGPRKPVRLGFPQEVVERWFPTLYPVE